jgi:hypothetical protein
MYHQKALHPSAEWLNNACVCSSHKSDEPFLLPIFLLLRVLLLTNYLFKSFFFSFGLAPTKTSAKGHSQLKW